MKNWSAIILGIISVLVLLSLMGLAYLMLYHPNKVPSAPKILHEKPVQHKLVVLDFDNNGLLDEAELMQGHDAVITVKNPKVDAGKAELFNSVSALQKLDVNKDGEIDEHDPIYPYLQLMFFTEGGKGKRYESFAQAKIKAIKIDQKRLTESEHQPVTLNVNDNILGQALGINGQTYTVRLIAVSN